MGTKENKWFCWWATVQSYHASWNGSTPVEAGGLDVIRTMNSIWAIVQIVQGPSRVLTPTMSTTPNWFSILDNSCKNSDYNQDWRHHFTGHFPGTVPALHISPCYFLHLDVPSSIALDKTSHITPQFFLTPHIFQEPFESHPNLYTVLLIVIIELIRSVQTKQWLESSNKSQLE